MFRHTPHDSLTAESKSTPSDTPPSDTPLSTLRDSLDSVASDMEKGHHQTSGGQLNSDGNGIANTPPLEQVHPPLAVGPLGGASPVGKDIEEGLVPVPSIEDEEEKIAGREEQEPESWEVKFEPGDKANPKNWSVRYRCYITALGGLLVLNSTFASSAPAGITEDVMEYFKWESKELAVLCISLFVVGYCVGPLIWGPLSETIGRRPTFIGPFIVYVGFQVGCALSKNTASILIFRLLSGIHAAAPLTNSGALIADVWDADMRGRAMLAFGLAPFAGPSLGPVVSGYISVSGASWRWVYWVCTMFAGICTLLIVFTLPETYAPIILVKKAKRLRKETGDDRWYAPMEKLQFTWKQRLDDIVFKPFIMLSKEPMLMAATVYMSFVYGVIYLLFEAYPYVFIDVYHFNAGENGLAFFGFFSGGVVTVAIYLTVVDPRYRKAAKELAPKPVPPEKRLELCVFSAWALVVAMFWFGWSAKPEIHWMSCVIAGLFIGIGALGMYICLSNYIIDTYLWAAASALAAATVVRSAFGAGFPLFANKMYERLGTQWASSLLGFIALVLAPVPMLLINFGPTLRAMSKYAPRRP